MPDPLDFTVAPWVATGVTADALGVLTEDLTSNRHSVHQDVQALVNGGIGTSAIYRARVRPMGRTMCWIGCRQNNALYMASFDLTGLGAVTGQGANISSASIESVGDGSYECRVNWNGNFSVVNTVFAIGALIASQTQTYLGTGIDALEVTEAQMMKGTSPVAYEATGDRESYADEATADGLQPSTLPAASRPYNMDPGYILCASNDGMAVSDFVYDLDALTVAVVCDWDGNATAEKVLAEHWEIPLSAADRAWKMALTAAGKLQVSLSNTGTTTQKVYTAVTALDLGVKIMCAFTWDGTSLRLYYNDTEITVASGEMTKDTDSALSGNLRDSAADILQWRDHYGKGYEFRMYTGAATPSEVATLASSYGLSGLPSGAGAPVDPFPTTLAGMITWLQDKGVLLANIRYVDNLTGSDAASGLTTAAPWATIQKAATTLTAGQAVIIRGRNGHFFEQVTPAASGALGNRIWYVGDPENKPILSGAESTAFAPTWTSMGGSVYRAPWAKSRFYETSAAYHANCVSGTSCLHSGGWKGTGLYNNANKEQFRRRDFDGPTVPALNAGECFFEVGTGSNESPQYVHVRMHDNSNPTAGTLYAFSNRLYSFDYSPLTGADGFPGGSSADDSEQELGRSHIGLVNLTFRYHPGIRKTAPCSVRGSGWHVERCAFTDTSAMGMVISGDDHYIYDCQFERNGMAAWYIAWIDGTTIERCRFVESNYHGYPTDWNAGNKIQSSGKVARNEFVDCYWLDEYATGMWFDIDNGKNSPSEDSFLIKRCFFNNCTRAGIFLERVSYYIKIEDTVVFKTRTNMAGNSDSIHGAGIRSQGAGRNIIGPRVVLVSNGGHGFMNRAWDDDRGQNNDDDHSYVAFVENVTGVPGGTVTQSPVEIHGGDGKTSTGLWTTSTYHNIVLAKTHAFNLFRNATLSISTSVIATFEGWVGATSNIVEEPDPIDVVVDHTTETGCYIMQAGYGLYQPNFINGHPKDLVTWVIPT